MGLDPLHQVHRVRVVELTQVLIWRELMEICWTELLYLHFSLYYGFLMGDQQQDDGNKNQVSREVHHALVRSTGHLDFR